MSTSLLFGVVFLMIGCHLPRTILNVYEMYLVRKKEHCTVQYITSSEPVFADLLRRPGIDFQPGGTVRQPYFSYRPVRLHRLAKSIPRNRFLGSINIYKYGLRSWPQSNMWRWGSSFLNTLPRLFEKGENGTFSTFSPKRPGKADFLFKRGIFLCSILSRKMSLLSSLSLK